MSIEARAESLGQRSIRTLAWLGDVEWERELRWRLAQTGDWPTDRLDSARASMARAEFQAQLLAKIDAELEDKERDVVARGRNASLRSSGRVRRDTKSYRAATGFEALVGYWRTRAQWQRFDEVVSPHLDQAITEAISKAAKPR